MLQLITALQVFSDSSARSSGRGRREHGELASQSWCQCQPYLARDLACELRYPLHESFGGMSSVKNPAPAGVNAYDCEGRTPIMLAMDRGNRRLFSKIVRRL